MQHGRSRINHHLWGSMLVSLVQTEVKLTDTFLILTVYFTGIVKYSLVLQQIKCQPFVLISNSRERKFIFLRVKLWKMIRRKTDSEPSSQKLDQLNITLLVVLARKISLKKIILPMNLWANNRPACSFILTAYRDPATNRASSRNSNKLQKLRTWRPYFLMYNTSPSPVTPTSVKILLHAIPS